MTTPDIDAIVAALTLEDKVALLAGADFWTTVALADAGVPAFKVTDGPNGARGARGAEPNFRLTSACFPCGIALAATWNVALVNAVGGALAEETRSKGAHVLLAPTVNIHRSPLNGRNFECYSEDPYLTARMAVAYITGLQAGGVGACVKHFVCNDSEFQRHTISSEVGERALREIYLPPFRAAVLEAGTWSLMSAYNRINGVYASENDTLLRDILKGEWGFDGAVISDWYGTYSDNVAGSALDLEMPGPARWHGSQMVEMVRDGRLDEAVIDDKVRRLLRLGARTGAFAEPTLQPERSDVRPEHSALIRRAAGEAAVLLKNDGPALPLQPEAVRSIAVIGVNAVWAPIMGGGSAFVTPHYVVNPLDGITRRASADNITVRYAPGCAIHKQLPGIPQPWLADAPGAEGGLDLTFYNSYDLSGPVAATERASATAFGWHGSHPDGVDPARFSVRLAGRLTVPESGTYVLGVMAAGQVRLTVDGRVLIDAWEPYTATGPFFDHGRSELLGDVALEAGRAVDLVLEYSTEGATGGQAVRVGCMPRIAEGSLADAAQLAAECDVAVVFAGTNGDWESEGRDRANMDLPAEQDALIAAVAAANPNTVVVLNTGSPVTMPWLDQVRSVVAAWFPGQESGNAIADVLFGDVNPSGKLPQTFPMRLEDNPAFINYPGENGRVHYGEGLFVGYRYYDKKRVAPLFPFGHGLSYTSFAYSNLRIAPGVVSADSPPTVQVDITNRGDRAGQEVVQLYVRDVAASLTRPEKELKVFAKVALEAGETRTVTFTLGRDALAFYDDAKRAWVVEPGEFVVLIGASAQDIRLHGTFTVADQDADAPLRKDSRLHVGLTVRELTADADARAVLEAHFPGMQAVSEVAMVLDMTLEVIAEQWPNVVSADTLRALNADLTAID